MSTLVFDTYAFVKELTQVGMLEKQAGVLAQSQATLIDERLATKQDVKELESRLTRDIKELEVGLRREMKELELRLTIRPGSMMVVVVRVVAALVKLS